MYRGFESRPLRQYPPIYKMNKLYNKILLFLFLVIALSGIAFLCFAQDDSIKSYYYDSIEVDITVNQDSTFDVIEKQTYNLTGSFGYFYRDIEIKDFDYISNIKVYDGQGEMFDEIKYDLSYENNRRHIQWNFPRRQFDNEIKSWSIEYKVNGGLGFYKEYDELYWNAIFADRDVKVKNAKITVHLPDSTKIEKARMFIGVPESKIEFDSYRIINERTIEFIGSNINPYEFLTIVVTWPKGIIEKPFLNFIQILNWLFMLFAIFIPIFVFIRVYKKWKKTGKDPKINKTIIAQYEPPENLLPGIVGILIDQKFDIREITATMINLAVRGYIKIKEGKKSFFLGKKYIFEKIKDNEDLKPFEQEIMEGIFKKGDIVSSSDLKNKFYKYLSDIKKELHQELAQTDYVIDNIQTTRKKSSILYILLSGLSFFGIISGVILSGIWIGFVSIWVLLISIGIFISGIIGLIFSYYMPALTLKGAEERWKWLGFKEYLHTAERFRIGAETVETFSEYLPYAIIFGVEKEWADRFADLKYQQPGWYVPAMVHSSSATGMGNSFSGLASSISSFTSSISSTFGSTPGGSGAGGAGGAGGGGGGGGGGGAG